MDIYELLADLRNRPGKYLGEKSAVRLGAFLDGWLTCEMMNGLKKEAEEMFPLGIEFMNTFVRYKTGAYESTPGWRRLILESVDGDEEAGVDRFFEYFDELRSLRIKVCREAVIEWPESSPEDFRPYGGNDKLYFLELTGGGGYMLCAVTEDGPEPFHEFFESEDAAKDYAAQYFGRIAELRPVSIDNFALH